MRHTTDTDEKAGHGDFELGLRLYRNSWVDPADELRFASSLYLVQNL